MGGVAVGDRGARNDCAAQCAARGPNEIAELGSPRRFVSVFISGGFWMRWIWMSVACLMLSAGAQRVAPPHAAQTPLVEGKRALSMKEFVRAKVIFAEYVRKHPDDIQGKLGLADAELALYEYEAAEASYRQIVAVQPLLWAAHKNLVIVEDALGRWEDFDGERTVLRAARERGAAGIDAHESDVIDVINVAGQRWIVRDYF